MKAACQRCGAAREAFDDICPSCGHRPAGEGLLVAWLLSTHNLDPGQLEAAAKRIADGTPLRPTKNQLDRARRALGRDFTTDPGLSMGELLGLFATSLVATPLVGWVAWWWWRDTRPRAALQSLALSAPVTLVATIAWPALYLFG